MADERKLRALERRVEQLENEAWDTLKALRDYFGALHRHAEHLEARHCAAWKKRHPIKPRRLRKKK